jgi:hypothetical protein
MAIKHLYALDLDAGCGIHIVQEAKLLAGKEDRQALDASIEELMQVGVRRAEMDQTNNSPRRRIPKWKRSQSP